MGVSVHPVLCHIVLGRDNLNDNNHPSKARNTDYLRMFLLNFCRHSPFNVLFSPYLCGLMVDFLFPFGDLCF